MINITFNSTGDTCVFKAIGHADYAPRGPDIVCSSISTLITTLAECLLQEDLTTLANVNLDSGNSSITFKKCERSLDIFKLFEYGIILVSKQYPDNVRIVI